MAVGAVDGLMGATFFTSAGLAQPQPMQRHTHTPTATPRTHRGLTYPEEDRLQPLRVAKTVLLVLILVVVVALLLRDLYTLITNILFDFYWHNIRHVTDPTDPHFLTRIWSANLIDFLILVLKALIAFYLFRFCNTRLLLTPTVDELEDLKKYN